MLCYRTVKEVIKVLNVSSETNSNYKNIIMPESAEDRSKRVFVKYLNNSVWTSQISIFYGDYSDALDAIKHSQRIRKNISRAFPDAPFLYRLCMKNVSKEIAEMVGIPEKETRNMPYHMLLTTVDVDKGALSERVANWLDCEVSILKRAFSAQKLDSYKAAVINQKPHNLKKFFNTEKINRIALLNKESRITNEN